MALCPTCNTRTRKRGFTDPRPYLTTGPTWFCSPKCWVTEPRLLKDYVDNRSAPGA